ncbi:MAG: endonuclease [Mariniphaga sp.]|nr:endonuclease [Mariniphaga sp.]
MRIFTFWVLFSAVLFLQNATAQAPAGYYSSASGLSGEALKTALHQIINDHTVVSYSSIWTHFQTTDAKPNGKVWDMYSDLPGNPPYEYTFATDQCALTSVENEGDCYNREHAFPRSWYGEGSNEDPPMFSDLHHVYPTDAWVNELRNYYPFGVVSSPTTTTQNGSKLGPNTTNGYSGTVFEPIDDYKGDFARTMFYMATRYQDLLQGWFANSSFGSLVLDGSSHPGLKEWYLDLMIQWHLQDPVSQKEIDRNNAVYAIQGNRNPFIDQPEYVNYIWGSGLAGEPMYHVQGFSANTITLTWNDATGAVLPDGYLLRMSETGFEAIADPVDGTPVSNDFYNQNVPYGKQTATFGRLNPGQVYYFKIFSYKGSGTAIDYKTDGPVPQTNIQAN